MAPNKKFIIKLDCSEKTEINSNYLKHLIFVH